MRERSGTTSDDLEQYRRYLRFLARTHLAERYQNRIDPSDIVQQTLLRAYEKREQYRGTSRDEKLGWLRKILVRTIQRAVRNLHAQCRDIKRELPIRQHDVEQSSMRLSGFLVSPAPEPSKLVSQQETVVAIADAIESLTDMQRQVILLKYWHHCTFNDIAARLQISVPAAAGIYYRAKKKLKSLLVERRL